MRRKRPASIARRAQWSFLILIFCLSAVAGTYSIVSETRTLGREVDSSISDYAYLLSSDANVRAMLERGAPDAATTAYLDATLQTLDKVDMLVVADTNSIRLYHPEKFRVGEAFVGGDQGPILAGAAPYITEEYGTRLHQRRAFSAVHGAGGEITGFVMVSAYSIHIQDMRNQILLEGGLFFLVALGVGAALSYLLSRSVKKSLLGYEPDQIAQLYLQNEKILDSLEEGIIAVDGAGTKVYTNAAARRMLSQSYPGESLPKSIRSFEAHLPREEAEPHRPALYGHELALEGGAILVSRIPATQQNAPTGTVYLLRDKAEQQRLAEQLTGVNHIVAALRANSHEHLNKLHVVLGLLEMQDTGTAMRYIEQITEEEEEDSSVLLQRIENKTIAALVLGKKRRAKERSMRLLLRRDSYLHPEFEHLSTDELVTIIGNLLENAMDAVEDATDSREITLYLYSNPAGLYIAVDDTGLGMQPAEITEVMRGSFSTKGEGHGLGLRLVREIIHKYGGTLEIESEPGVGSSFTVTIKKERGRQA